MIVSVQAHDYKNYTKLIDQMFQTRKRIFSDRFGWDVTVVGEFERDKYDDIGPVYLVWTNAARTRHYGSMRLMPTTGPTLLFDVFRNTFPDAAGLIAPGIWEGTRMCVDDIALAVDYPELKPAHAFCLLLVGLCEFALAHGIHTMVSNYEPHIRRLYKKAGAEVRELGCADGYGRLPVCCGAFEVSERVLLSMRSALHLSRALYGGSIDQRLSSATVTGLVA